MARQEMFVDLAKLKLVIDQLEDEQIAKGAPAHRPFRSRGELCKAVVVTDWGQAIGLTPSVVSSRIDRYSIECKTGVRYRGVVVPVAPVEVAVAPQTSMGSPGGWSADAPVVAPGAEPDAVASRFAPVVSTRRKSVYRGIDLDAFVAPFLERGLEIESLSSIMTSSLHSKNTNLKIQAAWHDLREQFNIPRVGDKPEEVTSVMPLDQVRLPGEQVDETVSEVVGDLPTDEELTADEFPELYSQEPTEGIDLETGTTELDRAQEEDLDQIQSTMDEINQEDIGQEIAPDSQFSLEPDDGLRTDLLPPLSEILAANNSPIQDSEPLDSQEDNISFDPEISVSESQESEEWLETGEVPLDEYPEVYPEREDPRAIEAARELDEWLAAGGDSQAGYQEPTPENPPQDEYLPLDVEDNPAPVVYDADNYDGGLYETEETDPSDTR